MTTPTIKEIADGLSEAQRESMMEIHHSFDIGDLFHTDGSKHRNHTSLVNRGLLERHKISGMGTYYSITQYGLAVRAHLQQEKQDD